MNNLETWLIGAYCLLVATHLGIIHYYVLKLMRRVVALEQKSDELPPLPPLSEEQLCKRCGHSKSDHEPLNAGTCFVPGCNCKGWKE